MSLESYLHKYAKVVLCSWLRKKIRIGPNFKGLNNIPLQLDYPKQSPMFDVYSEYPVCKSNIDTEPTIVGITILWQDWLIKHNVLDCVKSKTYIPTIYELKEMEKKKLLNVITVFDVGIIDKGTLKYIFEIQHTHPSTQKKSTFIDEHKLIGYEISAQKVMEQVKLPYSIDIIKSWGTQK